MVVVSDLALAQRRVSQQGAGMSLSETADGIAASVDVAIAWAPALRRFQTWQRAGTYSPGTVRLYAYRLSDLADTFPTPASVTTEHLEAILAEHQEWAPSTKKSVRGAWSCFFSWAYRTGVVPVNPVLALPRMNVPTTLPRPAPERVVRGALDGADHRLELMLMLAAFGGLRACEIARVHRDHLVEDLVGHSLHVLGKGRKERFVPVAGDLLERLLEVKGWAFPNSRTGDHITPGYVSFLLSKGLPEKWTAHTLRHRYATSVYAGTGDLFALMELLGHSRPETTMRYTKVPGVRVRAAAAAASSLAA